MTRRSLLALAFATLIVSIAWVGAVPVHASGAETFHLSKIFSEINPCTGKTMTGNLDATFVVQVVLISQDRLRAIIHASAQGVVTDTDGNVYHVSFDGTEQFDLDPNALPDHVDVPLHAVAISTGSAPNFTADGVATVPTDGSPVDATFTPSCQ
jgi:hypothetical protein